MKQLIEALCVCFYRYNREEVVRSLGKEVNLNPPLILGQLPDTPEELLKLDQVFIKSELKVGVIYVKEVSVVKANCLLKLFCFCLLHNLFFFFFFFRNYFLNRTGSIHGRTNFRQ